MNQAVNRILRTRPADPLSSLASSLLEQAKGSVPVLDSIMAKRVYIQESVTVQALKVQVYLNYQGRTEMRYEHVLTFDQDEHEKQFLYDNKTERTGLNNVCSLINGEISKLLKGTLLNGMTQVDTKLS